MPNLAVPGDLLRDPGEPYNEEELRQMVDFMSQVNNKSPKPTTKVNQDLIPEPPHNITHVYTKQHQTVGLQPSYCGPFRVVDRPSRSQVKIQVGLTKQGLPRYELRSWRDLKVAPEGLDVPEASRPMRGRKPTTSLSERQEPTEAKSEADYGAEVNKMADSVADSVTTNSTGKRSTRNPQPSYVFGISGPPSLHPFQSPPQVARNSKFHCYSASESDIKAIQASIDKGA